MCLCRRWGCRSPGRKVERVEPRGRRRVWGVAGGSAARRTGRSGFPWRLRGGKILSLCTHSARVYHFLSFVVLFRVIVASRQCGYHLWRAAANLRGRRIGGRRESFLGRGVGCASSCVSPVSASSGYRAVGGGGAARATDVAEETVAPKAEKERERDAKSTDESS